MIPEEYLVVEARINKELDNLRELEEELSGYKLFPKVATRSVGGFALTDTAVCRMTGSVLHDYYVAVENIFKVIAARIDRTVPSGESWHREILEQMTLEIPGVRPPVVARETARKLDELRAFRHVFRNVYGFNLSPERIRELLVQLPEVSSLLKRDVSRFKERMRKVLDLP